MEMPFGKYRGDDLMDLPEDYIEWVLENCDLRPILQKALEDQLAMRKGEGVVVDNSLNHKVDWSPEE